MNKLSIPRVPIDMDKDTREFLESLEDKLDEVKIVRVEDGNIHALGSKYGSYFHEDIYLSEVVKNIESGEITQTTFKNPSIPRSIIANLVTVGIHTYKRRQKKREFYKRVYQFRDANNKDIEETIKHIKFYQGDLAEVQDQLGKPLKLVDTGTLETYLEARDERLLRVKAYDLGADAIIHYLPEPIIGTPVRFVE